MEPFELFIREQAQNFPTQSLTVTLNKWNERNGQKPDYDNDPVGWALSLEGVTELLQQRKNIDVVRRLRDNEDGIYMGLLQAKRLMEDCQARLGLR